MDGETKVRAYHAPHEAALAAAHLQSIGIDARVDNQLLVGMNPLWDTALGGVRVMVPTRQLKRARRALARLDAELADRDEDEDDDLRSPDDEGDAIAARAFRSSVLGIFFCPVGMHLYSFWLLSDHALKLSPRGRKYSLWAKIVNGIVIGAAAVAVLAAVAR